MKFCIYQQTTDMPSGGQAITCFDTIRKNSDNSKTFCIIKLLIVF